MTCTGSLQLLLMKSGGQLIYSGSLGPLSRDLIKYFEVRPVVKTKLLFKNCKTGKKTK
jgi:hypothetical protein